MKDLKEGLSSARKADITHVRKATMVYIARPCEYGSVKYERANFLRPAAPVAGGAPIAADFVRFRAYLRAMISHAQDTLDAMELHQAGDPNLLDVEGMKRAAYAADLDETPGAKVGASRLPHVAHALATGNMAVTQAVNAGLLPADPGTPWTVVVPERVTRTAGVERACADGRPGCNVPIAHDHASNPSPPRTDFLDTPPRRSSPSSAGLDAAAKAGLW